jgi:hypothetical protein
MAPLHPADLAVDVEQPSSEEFALDALLPRDVLSRLGDDAPARAIRADQNHHRFLITG